MADLHISSEAEGDLDEIWLYVAKESQSIEHAELFLDRFAVFFSQLVKNPYLVLLCQVYGERRSKCAPEPLCRNRHRDRLKLPDRAGSIDFHGLGAART